MTKIFLEPNVNEITVGSIIRIDTKDLNQVEELKGFNYDIVDSFEDTYYIMPTSKKQTVKPKAKLQYHTAGGDMNFSYYTNEWSKDKKVRSRILQIICHESQLDQVLDLANKLDLVGCADYDKLENGMIEYSESFNEYDSDDYKEFKAALKQM